jgi:hypothetical protein
MLHAEVNMGKLLCGSELRGLGLPKARCPGVRWRASAGPMRIVSVPWPRVPHSHAVADREPDVRAFGSTGPLSSHGTLAVFIGHPAVADPRSGAGRGRLRQLKMLSGAPEIWFVPVIFDVRHKPRNHYGVDWTLAKHLVGDMNIAALGIQCVRQHDRPVDTWMAVSGYALEL